MKYLSMLGEVFQERAADALCALASGPSAWLGWALMLLAALPIAQSLYALVYATIYGHTARWGEAIAVWWAAWLDAHGMALTAMRVRAVNGIA